MPATCVSRGPSASVGEQPPRPAARAIDDEPLLSVISTTTRTCRKVVLSARQMTRERLARRLPDLAALLRLPERPASPVRTAAVVSGA